MRRSRFDAPSSRGAWPRGDEALLALDAREEAEPLVGLDRPVGVGLAQAVDHRAEELGGVAELGGGDFHHPVDRVVGERLQEHLQLAEARRRLLDHHLLGVVPRRRVRPGGRLAARAERPMLRQPVLLERMRPPRRGATSARSDGEGGVDRLEAAVVLGLEELGLAGALEHPVEVEAEHLQLLGEDGVPRAPPRSRLRGVRVRVGRAPPPRRASRARRSGGAAVSRRRSRGAAAGCARSRRGGRRGRRRRRRATSGGGAEGGGGRGRRGASDPTRGGGVCSVAERSIRCASTHERKNEYASDAPVTCWWSASGARRRSSMLVSGSIFSSAVVDGRPPRRRRRRR